MIALFEQAGLRVVNLGHISGVISQQLTNLMRLLSSFSWPNTLIGWGAVLPLRPLRMREWRMLLLPSHTEGHPLVALEACACRLPVAAVAGVLPAELERRPAVSVVARERYPELVLRLLRGGGRPPRDEWVRDHQRAAREWDDLLDGLPAWKPRPRPAVSRLRRLRRLRIPRRVARALLRRPPGGL